ncbi:MAG: D-alanine--D-alanine ligase [Anaerolineae bacterium]
MADRMRVGVVMGGRSSEREISLESGRNIFNTLDRSRFEPVPIYMDADGRLWEIGLPLVVQNTTKDIEDRLATDAERLPYEELAERVDFVYLGLHGKYGEDGCFQGLLELIDVPYCGSGVLGSALGMDKHVQRAILRGAGIDVPRTVPVTDAEWSSDAADVARRIADEVGFPCVVKPSREGCSTALAVVPDAGALSAAVDEALKWDNRALVEEIMSGMEVTVAVLGNEQPTAYQPTETPPKGDFLTVEEKFLPGEGVNVTPARLPDETLRAVRQTAEKAFRVLGLNVFARMDMYVTDDGRIVLGEPNTLPGSSPSSTIFLGPMEEGMGPAALLTRIVEMSLEAHSAKKGPLG